MPRTAEDLALRRQVIRILCDEQGFSPALAATRIGPAGLGIDERARNRSAAFRALRTARSRRASDEATLEHAGIDPYKRAGLSSPISPRSPTPVQERSTAQEPPPAQPADDPPLSLRDAVAGRPYHYIDGPDPYYLTVARSAPNGTLRTPQEVHEEILRRYSRAGGAETINQIASWLGWARPWVKQYLVAHGHTHDREPWSREQIARESVDELAHDALELKRGKAARKLAEEGRREIERDADRWRRAQETIVRPMRAHVEQIAREYTPPGYRPGTALPGDRALVINPTDLHLGKLAVADDLGRRYDVEIAAQRFRTLLRRVLDRSASWAGSLSRIYLAIGGDFLHVDNLPGMTTKAGISLDVDGTYHALSRAGHALAIEAVDLCRMYAPRVTVIRPGNSNHDACWSFEAVEYLAAWFRQCDDVEIVNSGHPRQYAEWGRSLLCFTHGDGVAPDKLPRVVPVEQGSAWGRCPYRYAFVGHKHHRRKMVDADRDINGLQVFQGATLAEPDRWHVEQGYTGARAGAFAHVIDRQEGWIGDVAAPVTLEDEAAEGQPAE